VNQKRPVGRPPKPYSPRIGELIAECMAQGKSLKAICGKKGIPSMSVVFHWLRVSDEFKALHARAERERAAWWGETLVALADRATESNTNAMRLKVDTRKWMIARLLPGKYGDRVELAVKSHAEPRGALEFQGKPPAEWTENERREACRRAAYGIALVAQDLKRWGFHEVSELTALFAKGVFERMLSKTPQQHAV